MRITLTELQHSPPVDKAIINSTERCLYYLSVEIGGEEYLVMDKQNRTLNARNKLDLQKVAEAVSARRIVLRHESAYDEMVGQPSGGQGNRLEVPLGGSGLGTSTATDSGLNHAQG